MPANVSSNNLELSDKIGTIYFANDVRQGEYVVPQLPLSQGTEWCLHQDDSDQLVIDQLYI